MSTEISIEEFHAQIVSACRALAAEGLAMGTAGNISVKLPGGVLATGSGVELAKAEAKDLVETSLQGEVLHGSIEPTSEMSMHLEVYRLAGDQAGAVVHCHPPHATAVSVCFDALPVLHYEQLALGGEIKVAPFAAFGTQELASHVGAALAGRKAALMANHGAIAYGATLDAAMTNMRALEWFCALFCRSQTIGTPRALSEQQQIAVIEQALRLGYGKPRPRL